MVEQASPEIIRGVLDAARQYGWRPEDLLTIMLYETGGTLSPYAQGREGHRGLIQFGQEEQRKYGNPFDMTPYQQVQQAAKFIADRGGTSGMDLLNLYSIVNAGSPGLFNRSDPNGAPGTVRDKVMAQMPEHQQKAMALLQQSGQAPSATRGFVPPTQAQSQAQLDPNTPRPIPASAPPVAAPPAAPPAAMGLGAPTFSGPPTIRTPQTAPPSAATVLTRATPAMTPAQLGTARDFDLAAYYRGRGTAADALGNLDPAYRRALGQLFQLAPPEIRAQLGINSGARDAQRGIALWQGALAKYGTPQAARHWVAPPGSSMHEYRPGRQGQATDLWYGNQAARDWVHANAAKVGMAFPMAWEPWHIEMAGARGNRQPGPTIAAANAANQVAAEQYGGGGGYQAPTAAPQAPAAGFDWSELGKAVSAFGGGAGPRSSGSDAGGMANPGIPDFTPDLTDADLVAPASALGMTALLPEINTQFNANPEAIGSFMRLMQQRRQF